MPYFVSHGIDALNTSVLIGGAVLITSILCGKDILYNIEHEPLVAELQPSKTVTPSVSAADLQDDKPAPTLISYVENTLASSENLINSFSSGEEAVHDVSAEIAVLKRALSEQRDLLKNCNRDLQSARNRADEVERSLVISQREMTELRSKCSTQETEIFSLRDQLARALANVEEGRERETDSKLSILAEKENVSLRASLDKALKDLRTAQSEIDSLTARSKALQSSSDNEKLRELELEISGLRKDLDGRTEELKSVKENFVSLSRSSESEASSLRGIIETFKSEIQASKAESLSVLSELDATRKLLARSQVEKPCSMCTELEARIAELQKGSGTASSSDLEQELNDARSEIEEYREVVDGLGQERDLAQKKLEDMQFFMKEQQKSFASDAKAQQELIEKLRASRESVCSQCGKLASGSGK